MALAQKLDKLGAVNLMLAAAGEQPVSTLVDDGINDTDDAQQVLNEVTIEVLNDGWDFNTVVKTVSPDSNNKIAISDNWLRIDGENLDWRRRFGVRSNYLYDLDNDTDQFTKTVDLRVTQNLEFNDLPSACRFYIARAAARVFQAQTKADPDQNQILFELEMKAWDKWKRDDTKTGDRSLIHDSRSTTKLIGQRRAGYAFDYDPNRPL